MRCLVRVTEVHVAHILRGDKWRYNTEGATYSREERIFVTGVVKKSGGQLLPPRSSNLCPVVSLALALSPCRQPSSDVLILA